jgi:hypothetical protein
LRNVATDDAAAAVGRLAAIGRAVVREDCQQRFSSMVVVGEYERLYIALCAQSGGVK